MRSALLGLVLLSCAGARPARDPSNEAEDMVGFLPNKSGTSSTATLIDLGASSWMFASTRAKGGADHESLMRGLRRWDPSRDHFPARPRLTLLRVTTPATLGALGSR